MLSGISLHSNPSEIPENRTKLTKSLVSSCCQVMYLDSAINRKPTVVRTLYNASLMAAFRFHAIVTSMLCPRAFSWGRGRTANTAFLVRGIDECCRRIGIHMKQLRRRHRSSELHYSQTCAYGS